MDNTLNIQFKYNNENESTKESTQNYKTNLINVFNKENNKNYIEKTNKNSTYKNKNLRIETSPQN